MHVIGTYAVSGSFDIPPHELRRAYEQVVMQQHDWFSNYSIEDGNVMAFEDDQFSGYMHRFIRKATEEDIAVDALLKQMSLLWKDEKPRI